MNFSAVELDLIVRGLFALEQLSPGERPKIQELLAKFVNAVWKVQP